MARFYKKPVYKKLDPLRPKIQETERVLFQNLFEQEKIVIFLTRKLPKIAKIKKTFSPLKRLRLTPILSFLSLNFNIIIVEISSLGMLVLYSHSNQGTSFSFSPRFIRSSIHSVGLCRLMASIHDLHPAVYDQWFHRMDVGDMAKRRTILTNVLHWSI